MWAQLHPELPKNLPGTRAVRRGHSGPKIQPAEVPCRMQGKESLDAYPYVRKTGDASVITLGAWQTPAAVKSTTVRLKTAESVKQGSYA